jgi:alpha-mannosidase
MRMKFLALVAAIFILPAHSQTASSPAVVWSVGTIDRSSGEFAEGAPSQPVRFVIGKDQPGAAWYAFAPSFAPGGKSDPTTAPRSIVFSIASAPEPAYRLTVSILIEHPSVPALRIAINGRTGTFFLHPKLDYTMGDTVAAFFPAYSQASVEYDFPGAWLHVGNNIISLQAVATGDREVPDAGFNYDAIQLERVTNSHGELWERAEPTIFYQKCGAALCERVDAIISYADRPRSGSVDLEVAGHHYSSPLRADQDFGEERVSFAVAEFAPGTAAHLALTLDGRRHEFTETLEPAKKWTLYLVPHVHLDVGYTDYQAKVSAIQSRILDEATDLAAKHPDFRFSTDGSWNLEQYLNSRSSQERQRMAQAIRDGKIFIPAQSANVLTGFPTAEALIRSLYPSAAFSRMNGTPFNYANITDVPSYSWSYASILAAAGIPYLFAGSNNDRAPVLMLGRLNERSPYYWEGPDGGRVLFWYSRHYMQMQFLFGLPPLVEPGEEVLPLFLQMYEHPDYHADAAIIFGTQVENTDLFPQQATLADEWDGQFAYPHLEYSGFHDALESIARQFGNDIPTLRGDGGPYWEDGIGSDAFYAALERENESRAPSAEKLATISSIVNPRLAPDKDALDSMWASIVLMDEHTWTSWNSVSDPDSSEAIEQLRVKDSRATTAAALRDNLLRGSMASLADSIAAGVDSIIVFNSLSWQRSGEVTIDLDRGMEIADRATGQAVPYLVVHDGENFQRVEFLAGDVPGAGYRVYDLRSAKATAPAPETATDTTLESPFYRVEIDPSSGAVRSIFDKQLQRELVDPASPWRFGQCLYVTGGDQEPNSILQYRAISPQPKLDVHPAASGRLVSVERTPFGWLARLESSTLNVPHIVTEIRLFDKEKKIEFVENLDKQQEMKKEALYFAFPFAMSHPRFQYEIQNGVVDPARDMYPGAGREWFSVQHWASVEQDGVAGTVMPLDTPLVTLGDINRGAWPTEFGRRPGAIFAYAMNNYWHTNYRAAQGGEFRFRFVVTSASATDAPALSRMGWEEVTPLEQDQIRSQDKALDLPRPLDGHSGQFLAIDDPDLLFDTWKPAEDGSGTILRLIDLGGAARTVTVSIPLVTLTQVFATDAVERNLHPLPLDGTGKIQVEVHPHAIVTLRLVGQPVFRAPSE